MFEYLRRLATTGAAYTASSVLSKLIAVFLLPIYTAYLTPGEYGDVEIMVATLVAASIVVRLGIIEAILRFYYLADERPAQVVRTAFASLFWSTTVIALLAVPFAAPLSELLLDGRSEPGLMRLTIFALWMLTLWEFVLTLLRLDERARTYFTLTIASVAVTIPVTVALVVGTELGPSAILLGNFGTGAVFLLARLWIERRRLGFTGDSALLRRMIRFGLPTMPAELTLYSLNWIDRIIILRIAGVAAVGLYALAVKFANGMQVLVRGFHLAWPPLAYSITDDDEARGAYSLIVTWFVAVCAFAVVGLWLLAPWLVEVLADQRYYAANEAVGPVAAGVGLYSLYLVQVVILGRTGRTEFSFPATAVAVAVNVGLNLLLVPDHGIIGAGVALAISYVVVVVLMYGIVQRLFPVPYDWRRLAMVMVVSTVLIAVGETVVSHEGVGGFLLTVGLLAAYPATLLGLGFLTHEERQSLGRLLNPAAVRERMRTIGSAPRESEPEEAREDEARGEHRVRLTADAIDQANRDSDRGGA